jgi:hypothetical protein
VRVDYIWILDMEHIEQSMCKVLDKGRVGGEHSWANVWMRFESKISCGRRKQLRGSWSRS